MTVSAYARTVAAIVENIVPFDAQENTHRLRTLDWLGSTSDIYRRIKPRTPEQHLVCYFVPIDLHRGRLLLVEHRLAGLWLPPGGHVEPNEHPWSTVRREAGEELSLRPTRTSPPSPDFLTVTLTNDAEPHTDVSLWYPLPTDSRAPLDWDRREFKQIRWWSPAEIAAGAAGNFDPHLGRYLAKTFPPEPPAQACSCRPRQRPPLRRRMATTPATTRRMGRTSPQISKPFMAPPAHRISDDRHQNRSVEPAGS
jgi:8-oxo-dGTP diphosphatase